MIVDKIVLNDALTLFTNETAEGFVSLCKYDIVVDRHSLVRQLLSKLRSRLLEQIPSGIANN